MAGFILDHRKELESDVWLMPPLYHRVWQWLKYNVNHLDNTFPMKDGSKFLIKRGQRMTSIRDIAKGVSWYEGRVYKEPNPKTIKAILDFFIKANMILINRGTGNKEYTLITLINYEIYNGKKTRGNGKVTANGQGRKQQTDINNNDNNENNENNEEQKDIKRLYADHVQMTPTQYEKLIKDFGQVITQRYILSIDDFFAQDLNRLKKYSDHSRMIRTWKRKDDEKNGEHGKRNETPIGYDRPAEAKPEKKYSPIGRLGKTSVPV